MFTKLNKALLPCLFLAAACSQTPTAPEKTASETPKAPAAAETTTTSSSSNNPLLIGAGALGSLLILAGIWMYWRDRRQAQAIAEEEDEEAEKFDTSEEVMDAIIALDDLHRARKISDQAYQKRRAELKDILKEMM